MPDPHDLPKDPQSGWTARRASDVHPMLRTFAAECGAVAVRIAAYCSVVGVLALAGFDFVAREFASISAKPDQPAIAQPGFTAATRLNPAFGVGAGDANAGVESYDIVRHPQGGRKDRLRWSDSDGAPLAALDIYRPGEELRGTEAASQRVVFTGEVFDRVRRGGGPEIADLENTGVMDSKFGPVALVAAEAGNGSRCLGFAKLFDMPRLQIGGWSCQAGGTGIQRAFLRCALDRLVLLSAGQDATLADLFARAELKRKGCGPERNAPADWVLSGNDPMLRGRL